MIRWHASEYWAGIKDGEYLIKLKQRNGYGTWFVEIYQGYPCINCELVKELVIRNGLKAAKSAAIEAMNNHKQGLSK